MSQNKHEQLLVYVVSCNKEVHPNFML